MSVADPYNTLPSLEAAIKYPDYAAVLVHAHCALASDEVMLANEHIASLTVVTSADDVYSGRWLADGTPYEFRRSKVSPPPPALISQFHAVVGANSPLGLGYIGNILAGKDVLESQDGRHNVNTQVDLADPDSSDHHVEAAWGFVGGKFQAVQQCELVDDRCFMFRKARMTQVGLI